MYAFLPGLGFGGAKTNPPGHDRQPRAEQSKDNQAPWTDNMLRQRVLSCLKDRSRVSLSNLGQEIPQGGERGSIDPRAGGRPG